MKKQFMAIASALALTLAMAPTAAFAAGTWSPSNTSTATVGNMTVTASVDTSGVSLDNKGLMVEVAASTTTASNYVAVSTEELIGSFVVDASFTDAPNSTVKTGTTGDANPYVDNVTVTVYVGTQYAGKYAKVYVQHSDGDTEVVSGLLIQSDGTITLTLSKLSIFTVVIDNSKTASSSVTAVTTDTSSKSPYTGVNTQGVAVVSGVALAAAAGCAVLAFRKSE